MGLLFPKVVESSISANKNVIVSVGALDISTLLFVRLSSARLVSKTALESVSLQRPEANSSITADHQNLLCLFGRNGNLNLRTLSTGLFLEWIVP